jgi:hypothetical protein
MTTHPEECIDSWAPDLAMDEQIAMAQSRNNHDLLFRKMKHKKKDSPGLAISPPIAKKGTNPKCMGTPRPNKLPEQLTAQLLPLACLAEKQARIAYRGRPPEDRRTLIERTWLYPKLAIGSSCPFSSSRRRVGSKDLLAAVALERHRVRA